jgi:membrane-bound lytic murein transglycosylase B
VLLPATAVATAALLGGCSSLPTPALTPEPTYAPPAAAPLERVAPASASIAQLADRAWLDDAAERTGIPRRALAAYAGAAIAKGRSMPECRVGWNTLAAIGWVESKHGTHGGSRVRHDGRVVPAIYGVALDGSETEHIPDSDDGRYDGDEEYDRAVGPMQMIPQTWRNWRTDANADGKAQPQNIDDAAMAAANYLCRASGDMVSPAGWQTGIAAYNSAPSYLHAIARAAIAYVG